MRAIARRSLFSLSALSLVATALIGGPAHAEPVVLDRIVAVVNDDIILDSDLDLWMMYDDRVLAELAKLQNQNASEEQMLHKLTELRPMGLDELVARKLMLAQAPTFQVTATDAEVEAYLQNLARNAGLGGVPELKRAVEESLRYGTWAQYRAKLREDIILYKLLGMLLNVAVSDQQVLDRYRQLSKGEEARLEVRRLVFQSTDDPAARDAQLKAGKAVVRRLTQGEDVEAIAAELQQSAELEQVTRSSVSRPIGERLFAATTGDVIGPLESGQGFVVFVVEQVVSSDLLGFEEAKEPLRQQIYEEVRFKAEADLREQLRGRAHVDIRL
ncbi:Peptidyl-prolyl cis-trans isomerase SurA [Enhygromyxa salina]|uniref:Peptidyl-prolyl cis-trans isomerase SurA n=1 Tax=Enhygromyxa salina TaxID=215803 RepID=A0A0C2CR12_9BACT|nr:peptidyl-prolyl cis-trans isomerase [Enhygromyxa salina]KIG12140.1 Peptidyl-prolyl cis-trans isomerase SurA [Enhygromyxa salina]